MSYQLPELGYDYNALEPVIDQETMHLHHDKHHATYVNNLNAALEGTEFAGKCLREVLSNLDKLPSEKQTAVRNNGGGHLNHKLFWLSMQPGGSKEPQDELKEAIEKAFGSVDTFKEEFQKAGAGRFGSGWVWLAYKDGELKIVTTPNQDNPVMDGYTPLLGNDVWEHAYYLNYQNRRADYLKEWWKVVNWDVIGERFAKAKEADSCLA